MSEGRARRIVSAAVLLSVLSTAAVRAQGSGGPKGDSPNGAARTSASSDMAIRRAEAFTRIKALTNNGESTRIMVRLDVPNVAALTRTAIAQKQAARGINADAQLATAIKTVADAELAKLAPALHTINRRYRSLPFLAMTVSREALTDLESSPVVLEVAEDRSLPELAVGGQEAEFAGEKRALTACVDHNLGGDGRDLALGSFDAHATNP